MASPSSALSSGLCGQGFPSNLGYLFKETGGKGTSVREYGEYENTITKNSNEQGVVYSARSGQMQTVRSLMKLGKVNANE